MDPMAFVTPHYAQPHRRYHTLAHIQRMLELVGTGISDELRLAILFHDAVYEPFSQDNEERSCALFRTFVSMHGSRADAERVCALIMATKDHFTATDGDDDAGRIVHADLAVLEDRAGLLEYERGIFFEYQRVPVAVYRAKRIAFLARMASHHDADSVIGRNCTQLIEVLRATSYRIGIYAGSFNPFHIGHLAICQQAEQVFDKVVIAQGRNSDKPAPAPIRNSLREVLPYDGLLTGLFTAEPGCSKILVRGLRNSFDVGYEDNLRNTILDLRPVPICYFFCQKQHEHISSSMIRSLLPLAPEHCQRYLPAVI